jgi:hypothetical protein
MKVIKTMNGKDFILDLPENVARTMLRTQSAYREFKEVKEEVKEIKQEVKEPVKAVRKPVRR